MKLRASFVPVFLVSIVFVFQCPASAQIVYDSLSNPASSAISAVEVGNTVTLASDKRFVTRFTFNGGAGSSHAGQTNDYILRFYVPSAPDNYPGKLIWQSPPKTNVVLTGETQSITFDVPYIRVPETFIYSVKQAGDGYFTLCNGPSIGISPNYCWTNLTKSTFSPNHMQVQIEAQDRPGAIILGQINHNSTSGTGSADHYTMNFEMELGGYWDLFGPCFDGVTEWDEGSFLKIDAFDIPEAVDYLINGVDETCKVLAEFSLKGNVESDTIIKSPGISAGYPDLYGCVVTDIDLKLNTIIIDHTTPDWTYYTWNVTWEIWGLPISPDINRDRSVNFMDYAVFSAAWGSHSGQPNWNPLCDMDLPNDGTVGVDDLMVFCSAWLNMPVPGLSEDFETGNFSSYEWQHSGNASWSVVLDDVYEGMHAAKSGDVGNSQQSVLEVEAEANAEGQFISFYRKVSSEANFDYLRFYIDGVQQGQWSGAVNWSKVLFPIAHGLHTFKWVYVKDSSISSGSDCAWIDLIKIE